MTAVDVLAALDLPANTQVDRRVPKTLLTDHGARTTADKRRIKDGIERVQWVAALKPGTVGLAAYRDDVREYLEVAVLHVVLRATAKLVRLVEVLHRAVPYPVVAVAEQEESLHLSLAHKRWSHGEAGKTVLDGQIVAVHPSEAKYERTRSAFLSALALGRQPQGTLFGLYQGWIDTLFALQAASRTGEFVVPDSANARAARREGLATCERLEAEIGRLRAAAAWERQVPRQVELNLELQRLKAEHAAALARL